MVINMVGNESKEVKEAIEVLKANGAIVFENPMEALAFNETENRLQIAREGNPGINIPDDDELKGMVTSELYAYLMDNEDALNYDEMDNITLKVISQFNS